MSDTVTQFSVLVPVGTAVASPVIAQCQLGVCQLDRIRWRVPPGANGNVGFYIASSLQQVIPFRSGATPTWIVANDESDVYELDGMPDSGDYQVVAYNLGGNPHTIYVAFSTTATTVAAAVPVVPTSVVGLTSTSTS